MKIFSIFIFLSLLLMTNHAPIKNFKSYFTREMINRLLMDPEFEALDYDMQVMIIYHVFTKVENFLEKYKPIVNERNEG